MKKIIAILLALAVVSMAFAQSVSIKNTLSTQPEITIDGGNQYWGFANGNFLREQVEGSATTADGRATVKARIRFDLQTLTPSEKSILSVKPRWSWDNVTDANDGNRSSVAAILKPFDFLEIGVGNLDEVGAAWGITPNLSWRKGSENFSYNFNTFNNLSGMWQNVHQLVNNGIQVKYVGVPGLAVGAGLRAAGEYGSQGTNGKLSNTMVKKGMFNGIAIGATYGLDLFDIGAKYAGNFGAENGVDAVNSDKAYSDHTIVAGLTFKGLREAKIGTSIDAVVGYYTAKGSIIKNNNVPQMAWIFGVGADFNFRNGITDYVAVEVGYNKYGSTTSKVLPFNVFNHLGYSVSSDAAFSLDAMYSQRGLTANNKSNAAQNGVTGDFGGKTATALAYNWGPWGETDEAWLIGLKPSFGFSMGAHHFDFGVQTVVTGLIEPHAKTGWEWGWTGLKGKKAVVDFPISWSYQF